MRGSAAFAVAAVVACGSTQRTTDVAADAGSPSGGTDGGSALIPDEPSCITHVFTCWDIGGACTMTSRTRDGEDVGAICWTTGACQIGPFDDGSIVGVSSGGVACFRELDPAADGSCEIGACTYRYVTDAGPYVLREFRNAAGGIVLQATCPSGNDPKPISERAFFAPIAWQEEALDACVRGR